MIYCNKGPSWPWSHSSWNYNYLCNQCLSRLLLWVRISNRARCTTLCDKVGNLTLQFPTKIFEKIWQKNIFLPLKVICLPSNVDYKIDIFCNVQCLFVNQNILHRLKSNWLLTISQCIGSRKFDTLHPV
jgi:hypothetical protein